MSLLCDKKVNCFIVVCRPNSRGLFQGIIIYYDFNRLPGNSLSCDELALILIYSGPSVVLPGSISSVMLSYWIGLESCALLCLKGMIEIISILDISSRKKESLTRD